MTIAPAFLISLFDWLLLYQKLHRQSVNSKGLFMISPFPIQDYELLRVFVVSLWRCVIGATQLPRMLLCISKLSIYLCCRVVVMETDDKRCVKICKKKNWFRTWYRICFFFRKTPKSEFLMDALSLVHESNLLGLVGHRAHTELIRGLSVWCRLFDTVGVAQAALTDSCVTWE